jgi:hypothetical protein
MARTSADRARARWHPSWASIGILPWHMVDLRQSEFAALNAWLLQQKET